MDTEFPKINQYRILIIEDDVSLRIMLIQFLKSLNYEVFEEGDGDLAFDRVLDLRPDLVLSDLNLPGMSGMEICGKIKSDARVKNIPVLMMTGALRSDVNKLEGFGIGADDYILKPIDISILAARINAILKQA